jgi:hypothetical protein
MPFTCSGTHLLPWFPGHGIAFQYPLSTVFKLAVSDCGFGVNWKVALKSSIEQGTTALERTMDAMSCLETRLQYKGALKGKASGEIPKRSESLTRMTLKL